MLIGSPGDDDKGTNAGAVYSAYSNSGVFYGRYKFFAEDPRPQADFGASLDAKGGLYLIGAPGHDDQGTGAGSAYFYEEYYGFSLNAQLFAGDADPGMRSVALLPLIMNTLSLQDMYTFW